MTLYARKTLILAGLEATYGVGAVLAGANAIDVTDPKVTPIAGGTVESNSVRPYMGARRRTQTRTHRVVEFGVEAGGAGAPTTIPAWGVLVRACGMAETVVNTVGQEKVAYTPVSAAFDSAVIDAYLDGQLRRLAGARGTMTMRFVAGELPLLGFNFLGLWSAPSAPVAPAPDYSAFRDAVVVSDANTPTFTLDGVNLVLKEFTVDLGGQVGFRDVVNQAAVHISDRAVTGTAVFDLPALADFDVEALAKAGTRVALTFEHGTVAGDILGVTAANVQLLEPSFGDDEGILTCTVNLVFVPGDSGGDDVTLYSK